MKQEINHPNKPTIWPVVQWWVLMLVIFVMLVVADHFGCVQVASSSGIE